VGNLKNDTVELREEMEQLTERIKELQQLVLQLQNTDDSINIRSGIWKDSVELFINQHTKQIGALALQGCEYNIAHFNNFQRPVIHIPKYPFISISEKRRFENFNFTPLFSEEEFLQLSKLREERKRYFKNVVHATSIIPAKDESDSLCYVMCIASLSWWPADIEQKRTIGNIPIYYFTSFCHPIGQHGLDTVSLSKVVVSNDESTDNSAVCSWPIAPNNLDTWGTAGLCIDGEHLLTVGHLFRGVGNDASIYAPSKHYELWRRRCLWVQSQDLELKYRATQIEMQSFSNDKIWNAFLQKVGRNANDITTEIDQKYDQVDSRCIGTLQSYELQLNLNYGSVEYGLIKLKEKWECEIPKIANIATTYDSNVVIWKGATTGTQLLGSVGFAEGEIRFLREDIVISKNNSERTYTILPLQPYTGNTIRKGDSGTCVSLYDSQDALGMIIAIGGDAKLGYVVPYKPICDHLFPS